MSIRFQNIGETLSVFENRNGRKLEVCVCDRFHEHIKKWGIGFVILENGEVLGDCFRTWNDADVECANLLADDGSQVQSELNLNLYLKGRKRA